MKARCIALLMASVAISIQAMAGSSPEKAVQSIKADKIIINKSAHQLILYKNDKEVKEYLVSLGRGPTGKKQFQGDMKTPEGNYKIDRRNDKSRYYKALHISYPNEQDILNAKQYNRSPGGDIMIHGLPNGIGWIGTLHRNMDWTQGCIAVTNKEIDEIWEMAPIGTPVEIRK
jgi:murein L,D-transpeptidase YafK